MKSRSFEPQLITVMREGYSLSRFGNDLLAGIIVGIVSLPLSIAFAIASGLKPEQGLITGVIAGFTISALSGSRVQIGGPTGAFIIIVLWIVQNYGYNGLAMATIMAGAILIIMGFARMGDVIKYIPYPVTVGFTSGIALVIFTTQIPDLFGMTITPMPPHFIDKWGAFIQACPTLNPFSLALGFLTVLIITLLPKITRRVPGPIVAILVTTALVHLLHLPVETIAGRFGEVPNRFPVPQIPHFNFHDFTMLIQPAMAIALLAGIESLLSAVVADGMIGSRHRSNMELIAQGAANLLSPIFGGIPATGAIARTATNIKNGGRTPVSGIICALVLLGLFLFCGKWAGLIPMAALSGILMVVAYNMSEMHLFGKLLRSQRSDVLVLLATFGLTVLVDLTVAIEVGVVMAAILFMHSMAKMTDIHLIEDDSNGRPHEYDGVPDGVEIFEINGPFFFGAADKFRDTIAEIKKKPRVLILQMRHVPAVDATALSALESLVNQSQKEGTHIIFAGVNKRVFKALKHTELLEHVGMSNILPDVQLALAQAIAIMEADEETTEA
jgi:SulP family sulfate permease